MHWNIAFEFAQYFLFEQNYFYSFHVNLTFAKENVNFINKDPCKNDLQVNLLS